MDDRERRNKDQPFPEKHKGKKDGAWERQSVAYKLKPMELNMVDKGKEVKYMSFSSNIASYEKCWRSLIKQDIQPIHLLETGKGFRAVLLNMPSR